MRPSELLNTRREEILALAVKAGARNVRVFGSAAGRLARLLADLSIHRLDMIIADRPMPTNLNVRGYSHLLGESGLTVFGARLLVKKLSGDFPAMLNNAPFLLPGEDFAFDRNCSNGLMPTS